MLRNSNYLFLQVNDSIVIVPWVNNAPDFSSLEEPALSVSTNRWNEFIDSGGVVEVIPDHEPTNETIPPNWDGFNLAFSTLPSLLQAELIANQNHPSIVGKKDLAYSMISDHGVGTFGLIFPLFCQAGGVDNDTRIEWALLAQSFNMPADLVSVIRG